MLKYLQMNNDETKAVPQSTAQDKQDTVLPPDQQEPAAGTSAGSAGETDNALHAVNAQDEAAACRQQPAVPEGAGTQAGTKKRRGGFFKKLCVLLLMLILIVLLPAAGLLCYAALDRTNPARHIPDSAYAVVSVLSASDTLKKGLYLSTADALLSSPDTAALQGNLRALRANPLLQAPWFQWLLDIPLCAAVYEHSAAVVITDLGIRSAATRRSNPIFEHGYPTFRPEPSI